MIFQESVASKTESEESFVFNLAREESPSPPPQASIPSLDEEPEEEEEEEIPDDEDVSIYRTGVALCVFLDQGLPCVYVLILQDFLLKGHVHNWVNICLQ